MLIINIQRGGPSTGLPTKTEQSDLFQAMFGRNGEAPLPIIAAASPSDCFEVAQEAWRIVVSLHGARHAAVRRLYRQRFRTLENPCGEFAEAHRDLPPDRAD